MDSIKVSISVKKDIVAVAMFDRGILLKKDITRIKNEDIKTSNYKALIHAINKSLLLVRSYINENGNSCDVTFEINNSTVKKWLDNQYSKPAYQDIFEEMLRLLHQIPMRYKFIVSTTPVASMFAKPSLVQNKIKLSSLDLDTLEVDENA